MKKKILISICVILALLIGGAVYRVLTTRNLSPKSTVTYSKNGLDVIVTYGRPSKKGRLIFGPAEEEALVPYGKYWRLGANESTEISFNKDVSFGGQAVKAGTYRMYTIPGENSWTVYLNSELGEWGYFEADHSKDVTKTEAVPVTLSEPVEQFTIDFTEGPQGIELNFSWDKTKVPVFIK